MKGCNGRPPESKTDITAVRDGLILRSIHRQELMGMKASFLILSDAIGNKYFFAYHVHSFMFIRIHGGGSIHNLTVTPAKMAIRGCFFHEKDGVENLHRSLIHLLRVVEDASSMFFRIVGIKPCCRLIFCISVAFCLYRFVGIFFALHDDFSFSGYSTRITTISLTSEAGSTDAKY
ncbi:MAG: hypothetical protein R2861_12825 [Desulfobacterales bacterium]